MSCSEFEEHAGSRERRPGESIYVTAIATSLKAKTSPSLFLSCFASKSCRCNWRQSCCLPLQLQGPSFWVIYG